MAKAGYPINRNRKYKTDAGCAINRSRTFHNM